MLIQNRFTGSKGAFFIEEDEDVLAELVYALSDDKMIIEHTQVAPEFQGKDVGYELVHTAVEYARMNNYKILPVCRFAKAVFDKKPDFSDVLA